MSCDVCLRLGGRERDDDEQREYDQPGSVRAGNDGRFLAQQPAGVCRFPGQHLGVLPHNLHNIQQPHDGGQPAATQGQPEPRRQQQHR